MGVHNRQKLYHGHPSFPERQRTVLTNVASRSRDDEGCRELQSDDSQTVYWAKLYPGKKSKSHIETITVCRDVSRQ